MRIYISVSPEWSTSVTLSTGTVIIPPIAHNV